MFQKKSEASNSNFWISYADLMAGLLFVFILLIGAIVSKSIILREDLEKKEKSLKVTESNLVKKEKRLNLTKDKLLTITKKLKEKENKLKIAKKNLKVTNKSLKSTKSKNIKQTKVIQLKEKKIRLQAEEVRKLHALLNDLKTSIALANDEKRILSSKLTVMKRSLNVEKSSARDKQKELNNLITLSKKSLKLKEKELEALNQLLLARNSKLDSLNKKVIILQNLDKDTNTTLENKDKKIQEYKKRVIILSNNLTKKEDELKLKDQKLADLLDAIDKKKTKYDDMIAKMKKQKAKIISLTGIKLKVIAELKKTLGKKIRIDRKSGALRLSSSILFDKGSSELKEGSMAELDKSFNGYIAALMSNEAIRPHLRRIVIEGHTDSDGTYLYNLELSQQRALAVMNYLLTMPIANKYNLKKYLVASGRAYLDSIKRKGIEDKDASRRIEIKFQLKNQDAMHQIDRIIGHAK